MLAIATSRDRVTFPESELEAALEDWWNQEAFERADDPFAASPKSKGTLYDLLPALDSLTIVRSFLIIERILHMEVPVTLVKPGGYFSKDEMLKDLLPKLQRFYEKGRV